MPAIRKYIGIVTLTIVTPEGEVLVTQTDTVALEADMSDFKSVADANAYLKEEASTLLAAGASNIENCF